MAIQAQFPSLGAQDWVDSACGGGINHFYFNVQQQQKLQQQQLQQQQQQQQQQCYIIPQLQLLQQHQQQQRVQNPCVFNNVNPVSSNLMNSKKRDFTSMAFPDFDQKQRREIDGYIRLQNERLRLMLQEQRKQQFALMLKNVESKVLPLLRQKDEEIAQLAKRKLELEDFLRKLETENQAWQRIAQENEAMIMSLNSTIEQLREKASCCFNSGAEDAESCCDVNIGEEAAAAAAAGAGGAGEAEQRNRGLVDIDSIKGEEEEADRARKMMLTTMMMGCKVCNSRNSCILFLPCRHLCSCKACEEFLDSCPVCQTPKKASIEALMA